MLRCILGPRPPESRVPLYETRLLILAGSYKVVVDEREPIQLTRWM